MSAIAYVNGRYTPLADAAVHVEDRGLQFGDSLYEVAAVLNGRLFDWHQHLDRLRAGAARLGFAAIPSDAVFAAIGAEMLRRARLGDGLLYIQLTRGSARRDHPFPRGVKPTLLMTARGFDFRQRIGQQENGVSVISVADDRWAHCDIKTTNLLPAVLAKQTAKVAGAFEAMFIGPDGTVREGGSTNIHMVDADGRIVTHPCSPRILPGIMRQTALRLAADAQITVDERPFSLDEARAAPELFLTSTTAPCLPIVKLDGQPVGNGRPGPVAARLASLMWDEVARQTGWHTRPARAA